MRPLPSHHATPPFCPNECLRDRGCLGTKHSALGLAPLARAPHTCVEQPEAEQQQQQQRQGRRAELGAAALLSPGGSSGGGGSGAGRCCSQAHARPCRSRGLRRGRRRGRRVGVVAVAAAWTGGRASLPLLPPSGPRRIRAAATAAAKSAPRAERGGGGGGNGAQRHRGGRRRRAGQRGRERRHKDSELSAEPGPKSAGAPVPASVGSAGVDPLKARPSLTSSRRQPGYLCAAAARSINLSPALPPRPPCMRQSTSSPPPAEPLPPTPLAVNAGPLGPARHSQGPKRPPPPHLLPPSACLL